MESGKGQEDLDQSVIILTEEEPEQPLAVTQKANCDDKEAKLMDTEESPVNDEPVQTSDPGAKENDNVVSPVDELTVVAETPESDSEEEEVAEHGEGHITNGSDWQCNNTTSKETQKRNSCIGLNRNFFWCPVKDCGSGTVQKMTQHLQKVHKMDKQTAAKEARRAPAEAVKLRLTNPSKRSSRIQSIPLIRSPTSTSSSPNPPYLLSLTMVDPSSVKDKEIHIFVALQGPGRWFHCNFCC